MAKAAKAATQRPQRPTRDQDARLRRLTVLDTLKGWTIPLIALGIALLTWPLSIAGLLETRPALAIAGGALLVAGYHMGVADFFDERTTRPTVATLLAFTALWAFVVYEPFAAKLDPGPEVFAGELALHGAPAKAPLGGVPGKYGLVVEGHLGTSSEHASRSAHYAIGIASDGKPIQSVEGDFAEKWSQRRSGRRGVSTVHVSHTEQEHMLTIDTGADLQLSLDSLSPGAHDKVDVRLYRDTFPTALFVGLGAALTAAAMVIDAWRFTDPQDLLLTSVTLGALLAVGSFRRFAPPHPGFGDLAFNGAVGAIAGMIGGRILARVAHAVRPRRS